MYVRDAEPLISHRHHPPGAAIVCAALCPTSALGGVDGTAPDPERCIGCGRCVTLCPAGAHVVRNDTAAVLALLGSGRPVVAMLATEYSVALHPMTMADIEGTLASLGFAGTESTALGEEIVAEAYERLHAREQLLSIRSTCPVAVSFVRKFYPALVPALAPIVPPYVAQARLIRAINPADVAIVYVGPCHARKDEIADPGIRGAVDAVIDFRELQALIDACESCADSRPPARLVRRPMLRKELSLTDGFPRTTIAGGDMTDGSVRVVRGIAELEGLLQAIAAGQAHARVIDVLECRGCLDGPAVSTSLSLYARRALAAAASDAPGVPRVGARAVLDALPVVEVVRSFKPVQLAGHRVRNGIGTRASETAEIPTSTGAATDGLRSRLELELARHASHGTPVSVIRAGITDIDGMVTGAEHAAAVAVAVGSAIARCVRGTDVVTTWPGGGFVLLLPATGKTAAFAVAEKLKDRLGDGSLGWDADGYRQTVNVTLAFGIASAGSARDADALLRAAGGAFDDAVAAGKGGVRLAPG